MGLAKAGELNGYPGPAHVLELSDELGLTAEQRSAVDEIHARMTAAAQPLGADILRRERDLDAQFADVTITESQLVEETVSIAEREGRLRAVHLAAHIATRAVLTPVQIARYLEIRGYALTPAHDMHGGTHHHAD
jgi:LTXXQ motif family protein